MDTLTHYDRLIDENMDPVRDPKVLRDYMDKWDGEKFIDALDLTKSDCVLEIGVGSGRLAVKTAPLCKHFCGIDISPKTVSRAWENLAEFNNIELICSDFLTYDFSNCFDIIYSSLTLMHFESKELFFNKVFTLLKDNARFVLSIDKNTSDCIDMGKWKLKIYPDFPEKTIEYIKASGMVVTEQIETEFAYVFVCNKF